MSGLPKLPGFNFVDPTLSKFHLSHNFYCINGYKVPKTITSGVGGREIDANCVGYFSSSDPVRYDPSLTYGRTRSVACSQFIPHFALYDSKCLTFKAFFKQSVPESPVEYYRVRKVNIIYFLEDDTITVIEPRTLNSGLEQGRIVRRGKIPKNTAGDPWHWKDFNVGKDICFNGVVYHTTDCDVFTKEFMRSHGLIMADSEQTPPDPYTQAREFSVQVHETKTPPADDKLRRFLEYDGKVLTFDALYDTRDQEFGELRVYGILYYLADDTIAVQEIKEPNGGRDPFPLLLRKTKVPKVWTDRPETYPSVYLELSDAEVTEYYQPKDLLIGETIYILGRPMLLVNCNEFTRNYYRKTLCIEQKPAIDFKPKPRKLPPAPMPPHDGIGSLQDSLQNTKKFSNTPPKKDVIRQLVNANKHLRYMLKIDLVHPEDEIRRFILRYSLSEGTCNIYEPPIRNSGVIGGKYLSDSLVSKPGSDPLNPDYYTPADFYIGALLVVHQQRFIIIDADLYVYRYMQANPEKFPCTVIENIRNHMFNKGFLTEDIAEQLEKECQDQKKAARDAIGLEADIVQTELEKCFIEQKVKPDPDADLEYERKKAKILEEYTESLKHKYVVPEHGIDPVNLTCPYPIVIGEIADKTCKEQDVGGDSFTPKHIDTPAEKVQKHYAEVYRKQHEICDHPRPIECEDPEAAKRLAANQKPLPEPFEPIMVSNVENPKGACKVKAVHFADDDKRCLRDKYDLCDHKTPKNHCGCTQYQK
ncbi:hypothetical protein RN001_008912 [Aquatica leii]|uniref:DM10 domain-containing protein n=1 Tax=Aquatica leii TaxID=1421715 RepID=A0AAN7PDZ2_9COLE|nr:hypothetical protein RN001_008912 [Aquatica leii]